MSDTEPTNDAEKLMFLIMSIVGGLILGWFVASLVVGDGTERETNVNKNVTEYQCEVVR